MSGGGEGDRPGAAPSGASGDRQPARSISVRRVPAQLFDLEGRLIARADLVIGAELPKILMFNGDPFLRVPGHYGAPHYRQEKPYRADVLVTEVLR